MLLTRRLTLAAALSLMATMARAEPLEHPHVILGAGGLFSQVAKLPLVMARALGYFKDEGLDVEFIDFGSGAKGAQALIAGNTDFVSGAYEHTIDLQAKGMAMVDVVGMSRYPGYVLVVPKSKAGTIKTVADLKGKAIGVSAPGSGTQVFAVRALEKVGLKKEDASYVGIGLGPTAVAAARAGQLDALVTQDPATTEMWDDVVPLLDARDAAGTVAVYGGDYVLDGLYTSWAFVNANPRTTQAVVNATVRAMLWLNKTPIDEIVAKVPAEYIKDKDQYRGMLKANMAAMNFDGRITPVVAQNALQSILMFQPNLKDAKIDLSKTYDNHFIDEAMKKFK